MRSKHHEAPPDVVFSTPLSPHPLTPHPLSEPPVLRHPHITFLCYANCLVTIPTLWQLMLFSFARISFDFQATSQELKHTGIGGWHTEERSTNRVA